MRKLTETFFLLLLINFSACSFRRNSETPPIPSNEEIKAAWEKSMTKSQEHLILEEMAGRWQASVKFWAHAGSEPNISTAKSNIKTVLNGKFLIEDYQGTFAGKPFQGMSIMGYDTILNKFSNYWADNMGTGAIFSEGNYDPVTKTIYLRGDVTDPLAKSKQPTQSTVKIVDKDTHILEMFDVSPKGSRLKTLEITYKRIN